MVGNDVSVVHRAFNSLFTTLTPEQVQGFLQQMNAANVTAVSANSAVTSTPSVSAINSTQDLTATSSLAASTSIPNNAMARKQPARTKRTRENAKTRPLNSFIAFRSFYSAVFPDLSQKVKSGLLRLLWSSDPFKAKWAILAKAYSIIRDRHTGQVSLDTFLRLNAPIIGIIQPVDYLTVMNMQLVVGADKQYSLIKSTQSPSLNQNDLTTNLSAADIVDHCYKTGYVTRVPSGEDTTNKGAGVAMAVSAQVNRTLPAVSSSMPCAERSHDSHDVGTGTGFAGYDIAPAADDKVEHNGEVDASQFTSSLHRYQEETNMNTGVIDISENNNNIATYTAANFEEDLRNAMREYQTHIAGPEDDYYGLFDPMHYHQQQQQQQQQHEYHHHHHHHHRDGSGSGGGTHAAVVYNPYRTHNEFDPFDMNAYPGMMM